MKVVFDTSFNKDLSKIKESSILKRIEAAIVNCEQAKDLREIRGIKKLKGHSVFYRIRISDYRLGLELEENETLRFVVFKHRKDIYKKFT